jgi:RecA-family ATPase
MRELRDNAAKQGRASWWPCLGVLAFCEDGDQFAHAWGRVHPKYSVDETQRELDGWRRKAGGATHCETFDGKNPGICGGCQHRGALRSPISLGMRLPEPMFATDAPSLAPTGVIPIEFETQSKGISPFSLGTEARSERIGIIGGDELLATKAPPRRWLVDRFVPAAETTAIGGDGGTGKTTLALQLAVACVSGGDWIGLKVNPCNVLYVSAEDPAGEIHFRLEQITKHSRLSAEELARFKLIDLAGSDATIATFDKNTLIRPTSLFLQIESASREHQADCIIFDSVADFFGGNENERREVRAFVALLRGLAMRLDAAVIFLAHPSVDGIKSGRGYSGSTHWNNAVRSRLYFTDGPGGEAQPDLRVIELAKSNRARRGEKISVMWMDGRFIEASAEAVLNSKNEAENDELFLQLLSKLGKQGRSVSPNPSITYAPTAMAKMPPSKGVGKPALERAMHRLLDKGKIRVEETGPPSKRRHRLVAVAGSRSNGVANEDHASQEVGVSEEPGPPSRGGLGATGGYGGLEGTPVGRALGGSFAGNS